MKCVLIPRALTGLFLVATMATNCPAISSRNVLVLVNDRSMDSKEVANYFIRLRHIPARNVVYLDIPDGVHGGSAELSREEFTRYVWEPVWKAVKERNLGNEILAWVYSADFPVKFTGEPQVSLQGITFAGNQSVDAGVIKKGTPLSPYFAGPDKPGGSSAPTRSFEQYYAHYQGKVPMPSMMLGYTGARGMDVAAIVDSLRRGVVSDGTKPDGKIFLVEGKDVRARCRAWQFPDVKRELDAVGVRAVITTDPPVGESGIMGFMTGTHVIDPRQVGTYKSGCMADHLTSYGAAFNAPDQTKISEWLRAGATASAGTITEPYAVWTKFPHARFYAHYAAGGTMIESFYQALASPLQILLLGEPLARPWADPVSITVVNLKEGDVSGQAQFAFRAQPETLQQKMRFTVYMDDGLFGGKVTESLIEFDSRMLSDGYHELSAVAYYDRGALAVPVTAALGFSVNNKGRSVRLTASASTTNIDLYHPLALQLDVAGSNAVSFDITSAGRVVGEGTFPAKAVHIDPARMGPGPVTLSARVRFDDSTVVVGQPLALSIGRFNRAPNIEKVDVAADEDGVWTRYRPQVTDPEQDPVLCRWLYEIPVHRRAFLKEADKTGGDVRYADKMALFSPEPTGSCDTCFFPVSMPDGECVFAAEVAVTPGRQTPVIAGYAGIAFNRQLDGSYAFFGIWGHISSWVMGVVKEGRLIPKNDHGAYIRSDQWYRLMVVKRSDGWAEGWVGDERICLMKLEEGYETGNVGLMASVNETGFRNIRGSTGMLSKDEWKLGADGLSLLNKQDHGFDRLILWAFDGYSSAIEQVDLKP